MLYASTRDCLDIMSDPSDIAFDCVERAAPASIRMAAASLQILSIAATPRERSA
jgi:hypothetical protein